jgi:hypothetical protein
LRASEAVGVWSLAHGPARTVGEWIFRSTLPPFEGPPKIVQPLREATTKLGREMELDFVTKPFHQRAKAAIAGSCRCVPALAREAAMFD